MKNECVFCGEAIKAHDRQVRCKDRRTGEKCSAHDECWWQFTGYVTHEREEGGVMTDEETRKIVDELRSIHSLLRAFAVASLSHTYGLGSYREAQRVLEAADDAVMGRAGKGDG